MQRIITAYLDKMTERFSAKSPLCIATFLGTACSSNFYTSLDVKMPTARIGKIMNTLKSAVIIADLMYLSEARTQRMVFWYYVMKN